MAYKIKLTYFDGRVEEVLPSARARVDTERHFGGLGQSNQQEATLYMAWAHLKKTGGVAEEYDPWLDLVADVSEVQVDDVRPTPPVQSADTSSD